MSLVTRKYADHEKTPQQYHDMIWGPQAPMWAKNRMEAANTQRNHAIIEMVRTALMVGFWAAGCIWLFAEFPRADFMEESLGVYLFWMICGVIMIGGVCGFIFKTEHFIGGVALATEIEKAPLSPVGRHVHENYTEYRAVVSSVAKQVANQVNK